MYHPAMQYILRLAATETKNESTHEICLFWNLFKEILSEIMERDHTFNPKAIMVGENSANYCMIRQVFGVNFVTSKVLSCHMHYTNDVSRVSLRIGLSYRDLFKSICYGMCFIATVAEYNEQNQWLDEIANLFPYIS